jgi:hypothetical protein
VVANSLASGTRIVAPSTSAASAHMPSSYSLITPVIRVLVVALPSSENVRNGKLLATTNRISAARVSISARSMLSGL